MSLIYLSVLTPEEAIIRECEEELGIKVNDMHQLTKFKESYTTKKGTAGVTHTVFVVDDYSGKPKNVEKEWHRTVKFMPVKELKKITNLSNITNQALLAMGYKPKGVLT